MTIDYRVLLGQPLSRFQLLSIEHLIETTFQEVNALYNQWNPDSEISALNALQAGEKRAPSPALYALLVLADEIFKISKGRYDPTVGPLHRLWIDHLNQGLLPPQELLDAVEFGWNKIHLEEGWFWKDHSALSINLDSLSKGLAVDLLFHRLKAMGMVHFLVEWGGEFRASGMHPTGRSWRLSIRAPQAAEAALTTLDLKEQALATSGDYLQYWTVGTETFFHIMDPLTRRPLTMRSGSITSATVSAPSCVLADALATAIMLCPTLEEAKAWAAQVQEKFPVVFYLAAHP